MEGTYTYLPLERVIFGRPAAEAAAQEAARIGARRVFIVASRSLARETPVVRGIGGALGGRYGSALLLRAVGVEREQLPAIAAAAINNLWVRTNPQPIRSAGDVLRLLEAAW